MKELVIISGKGGTGKTSLTASLATLADKVVLADCDVDAADLHLVLDPAVGQTEDFIGGKLARVNPDACTGCGKCVELCRFEAITLASTRGTGVSSACRDCEFCVRSCPSRAAAEMEAMSQAAGQSGTPVAMVDPIACEQCGVCAWFCPADAIDLVPSISGQWFVSETRVGPMVHAKLGVAEGNSGKLVSTVRRAAVELAGKRGVDLVLIDGSPGIGCPVIASITGADLALIVTEPTVSGLHDMRRAAELAEHFKIPTMVCVNKWDLNPDVTAEIERHTQENGAIFAGRIRYDRAVTDAQINRKTLVEYQTGGAADDIRAVWATVSACLDGEGAGKAAD